MFVKDIKEWIANEKDWISFIDYGSYSIIVYEDRTERLIKGDFVSDKSSSIIFCSGNIYGVKLLKQMPLGLGYAIFEIGSDIPIFVGTLSGCNEFYNKFIKNLKEDKNGKL